MAKKPAGGLQNTSGSAGEPVSSPKTDSARAEDTVTGGEKPGIEAAAASAAVPKEPGPTETGPAKPSAARPSSARQDAADGSGKDVSPKETMAVETGGQAPDEAGTSDGSSGTEVMSEADAVVIEAQLLETLTKEMHAAVT